MNFFEMFQSIDLSVLRFLRENVANPVLDFLMPLITLIGEDGILWIIVSLCLMCFKKTRRAGFVMGLSLVLGFVVINLTIKPLVARQRPYVVDNVTILIESLKDGSFPSGHAAACFECAVSLLLCKYKKAGIAALIAAFLVAFSRLYLYVHYPTDVVTGAVLGVLFAFVSYFVVDKLYKKFAKNETL